MEGFLEYGHDKFLFRVKEGTRCSREDISSRTSYGVPEDLYLTTMIAGHENRPHQG
jgi:hypothetical protein